MQKQQQKNKVRPSWILLLFFLQVDLYLSRLHQQQKDAPGGTPATQRELRREPHLHRDPGRAVGDQSAVPRGEHEVLPREEQRAPVPWSGARPAQECRWHSLQQRLSHA